MGKGLGLGEPLPQPPEQRPVPFGAALLPGNKAGGKPAEPLPPEQVLQELRRQVHIGNQGHGLSPLPQGLHRRQKVGVAPAKGCLHFQLSGHALFHRQGGELGKLLPDLPEGHLAPPSCPAVFLPGKQLRLYPQPAEIRVGELGAHQGKSRLWVVHLPKQQGVKHVEGNQVELCQPVGQKPGVFPLGLGGLAALGWQGGIPALGKGPGQQGGGGLPAGHARCRRAW